MSVASFLCGSKCRYDEPRYALVLCLCAALVLIFLAAFSAPMTDAIYFVKLTVQPDDPADVDHDMVTLLGALGYCWKGLGVESCSRVRTGYQLGQGLATPTPIALPLIPTWSTSVLFLQVVTFGVTFIVSAIIVSAHFVHTYLARWPLICCGIAALMQLACYVFDVTLFSVTRSAVGQSGSVKIGNGTWLAMVAFILLCGAILGDFIQLYGYPRRRAETHTVTPYTIPDAEAGMQDDSSFGDGDDVLDLIPANDRRSLDQPTIDIIYYACLEGATSTTSPGTTTTEELESALQASRISPVTDSSNLYKQHFAGSGQFAPDTQPISNPDPGLPNKAITLPDAVVTRQVPSGPREARRVTASQRPLPPLVPVRRKTTITRYVPSTYSTYQSRRTSDSDQTISTTTFLPRSSTYGFPSRAATMRSEVLPPMSERYTSSPSITTRLSEDFQLPHFEYSVGSTSSLSSAWNSLFQKLAPSNPQTPPMPHFPISSHRFGGDRFVEGHIPDADTCSVASAVQSSDLEHSTDMQHVSGPNYPIPLDGSHSRQDRRIRRLF